MWVLLILSKDTKVVGPFDLPQEAAIFAAAYYSGQIGVSATIIKMIDPKFVHPDRPLI